MSDTEGLSYKEVDLAALAAARGSGDYSLAQLLVIAKVAGLGVTFLVDGALVSGSLATGETWGEYLDGIVEGAYEGLEEMLIARGWPEDAAATLASTTRDKVFSKAAKKRFERGQEHTGRMMERAETHGVDEELVDLPRDLARAEIGFSSMTPVITLVKARIVPVGAGVAQEIGTMRVLTQHIAAWWPGTTSRG